MDTNCIFCKIVKGEIPCSRIYEDSHHVAFLDIAPVNKGHTLLIPKKHYSDLFEMPDAELKEISILLKKLGRIVMEGVKADGVNVGMNNKAAAGQVVFHAHFHIIPRFAGDGLKHWPQKKYESNEEMERFRKLINAF